MGGGGNPNRAEERGIGSKRTDTRQVRNNLQNGCPNFHRQRCGSRNGSQCTRIGSITGLDASETPPSCLWACGKIRPVLFYKVVAHCLFSLAVAVNPAANWSTVSCEIAFCAIKLFT